jgi:hypothetical protein
VGKGDAKTSGSIKKNTLSLEAFVPDLSNTKHDLLPPYSSKPSLSDVA